MPLSANTTDIMLLKYLAENDEKQNIDEIVEDIYNRQNANNVEIYPIFSEDGKCHSPDLWRDLVFLKENFFIRVEEVDHSVNIAITFWGRNISHLYRIAKNIEQMLCQPIIQKQSDVGSLS